MSRASYLCDIKLCLESLARFEIYPDLAQLEQFLADETHQALIQQLAEQIKNSFESMTASPLEDWQSCAPYVVNLEKTAKTGLTGFKNLSGLIPEPPPESETVNPFSSVPPVSVRFKLPNATVGKPYQAPLEWQSDKPLTILKIEGLDELGLSYDVSTNILTGEPLTAGEYLLTLNYQIADEAEAVLQTAPLKLLINSNPKNLWKNIPSDNNQPFWKADSDCQGVNGLYGWKMAAASVRGRSHAHIGSCRDDDFALSVNNESLWHVLAVADGAGSSEYSREGARLVAHKSVEILNAQLQQDALLLDELISMWQDDKNLANEMALHQELVEIFKITLNSVVQTIENLAQQEQKTYRDFYSTLLVVAHKSFLNGEFVVAYWIGDGALGLYQADKSLVLLGESDSGEYAGQTRFLDRNVLSLDDLSRRVNFVMAESFSALILMTDGVTDPLFETEHNLQDLSYWQNLWQQLKPQLVENPSLSAKNLQNWLDFWSPGNHDDRTIALLYR